jgi:DNA topoisomerase-1
MDTAFTRHIEDQLDKIEEQHLEWTGVLKEFYEPFSVSLEQAGQQMKHAKAETQPSDYTCPKCEAKLVYRFGKKGRFLSCSKYPDCKFASPCDKDGKMIKEETTDKACPNCGKPMAKREGRYGPFLGCSDYPNCKTILKVDKDGNPQKPAPAPQPTGITCHKCKQGELVVRQSKRGPFMGCNRFPRCRTIVNMDKLDMLKDLQSKGQWPPADEAALERILGKAEKKTGSGNARKRTVKKKEE